MNKNDYQSFEGLLGLDSMELSECCNDVTDNTMNCNIDNMPLAMAYVPMQRWGKVYSNDVALNRGTIFPELDLPFLGHGGMKHE